jgi:cell division transport system permease protein
MKTVRYSLQEALLSLRRAARSTVMSIGTVAVAFVTLGGFVLIATNLQRVVQQWAAAAEMSVFLRDDIDAGTRAALQSELQTHRAVEAVEDVTKEQALARFRTDFPELADVAQSGARNPFPASFELRLRTDPESAGAADALAMQLTERPGVADVRYDRQWLDRVMAIITGVRVAGLAIAGVLVLGAAFTVAAVVRLSLFARRDEIEIMRLVGAPFAFIRGPSVAEGTLIGGLGAAVALLLLWALFVATRTRIREAMAAFAGQSDFRFLEPSETALIVLAALVVGGLTGVIVSRAVR